MKKPLLAIAVITACSTLCPAQTTRLVTSIPQTAPAPARDPQTVTPLEIAPRAVERPALAYSLTWRADETRRGNSAVKYLAAVESSTTAERKFTPADFEAMDKMRTAPLADIDEAKAQEYLQLYSGVFRRARDGSRLDSYEPESNMRIQGITAEIPALSRYRQIANMLAIAIRLDIKHHRWSEAREKLATGYSMARHISKGETLIESLVAASIATVMGKCVEDWASQGGPNLYWSLVNLPRPFIDLRHCLTFERDMAVFSIPEMREMRDGNFHAGQWTLMLRRAMAVQTTDPPKLFKDWKLDISAALLGAAEYPRAKEFLIARGMNKNDVEKMPVTEVLGRYFVRSYDEVADEIFKVHGLPPYEAEKAAAEAEKELKRPIGEVNLLARFLLPSLGRAGMTAARVDRQVHMLQIVEALRAHAAEKGSLPDKLDDLKLPIPIDPTTGKAFTYERAGEEARLISPATPSDPRRRAEFVITLKK